MSGTPSDDFRDLPSEEARYAGLLVQMGICTRSQVDEGLRELRRQLAAGASPKPTLSAVLVARGSLSEVQLQSTLALPAAAPDRTPAPPVEAAVAAETASNRVGKYIRVEMLGSGGMGEVWKAWDQELRRWVALKFLHHESAEQLARFRREAQLAARLNHPNIAAVYEVGDAGGRHYIAMQYVPGRPLKTARDVPARATAALMRDAALAIHAAHEQGTIHRDLKPGNLMVVDEPAGPRVFVLDFGLARPAGGDSSMSGTGVVLGTPAYMSPEQARADSHLVGPASDIYGLGATLYEGLTGRPPFYGADSLAVLRKVVDDDPVPVRSIAPAVDRDLETIVMKCLEKDPARRYATALALAEDLGRWLAGEPILSRRPSVAFRVSRFVSRRKGAVVASALGAAALAILLPAWAAGRTRERSMAETHEKERAASARRERFLRELGAAAADVVRAREWIRQPSRAPAEIRKEQLRMLGVLDGLVAAHPEYPQGFFIRARVRLGVLDLAGADADLREALRVEPDFGPAWSLLARVRLEQQLLLRAHPKYSPPADAARALVLQGEAEDALRRADRLEAASSPARWGLPRMPEDEIQHTLVRAIHRAYLETNPPGARELVRREHEKSPSEEYARYLGVSTEDFAERRRWFDEALRLAPHYAAALNDRAAMRAAAEDWPGALEDYTRALELQPALAMAHNNRSHARLRLGDSKGAMRDVEEALRLDPDLLVAHHNRAFLRELAGDLDGALEGYTEAIRRHPGYYNALMKRGHLRFRKGDLKGAKEDFDRAIESGPGEAEARLERSRLRRQLGDLPGAAEDADKAVELAPASAEAWFTRGNSRADRRQIDRAIDDYTKAIELNPKLAAAYRNRGSCWILKKESRRIEEDFTKSIELEPGSTVSYVNRGAARLDLGNAKGAVADLEEALRLAPPDWPHAEFCRSTLKAAREAMKK